MKHEKLWTLRNKLRALWGEWDGLLMGSKEGTYCMVHWVLYASNESWNITSKTNDASFPLLITPFLYSFLLLLIFLVLMFHR